MLREVECSKSADEAGYESKDWSEVKIREVSLSGQNVDIDRQ
jgi:hypothetical protein